MNVSKPVSAHTMKPDRRRVDSRKVKANECQEPPELADALLKRGTMKRFAIVIAFSLLLAKPALAEGEGDAWFGFGMTTSVSLFMNITSMAVNNLQPGSEAERAGVRNGQKITAIAGCRIPGCGAREARKLFNVAVGETVVFAFEREDGSTFEAPLKAMKWGARSGASSQ